MKNNFKKSVFLIVIVVLVCSLLASVSLAKDGFKIGVVVKSLGNPFFREICYGAKEQGERYGAEVIIQATAHEGMILEQIDLIENLIQTGIDGLVITPQNSEGIAPAIISAKKAGIPCIVVDTFAENVELDAYLGMDNIEAGKKVAKLVCEKLDGKGNIAIIEGMAGASSSILRSEGFRQGCAEYPGIKIVADQNADFRRDVGQRVMADILQANKIDGILCANDLMALGAIVSLQEAGYKIGGDGGVVIGSYDISDEILEAVKAGEVLVTGYHWGKVQGRWGVDLCMDLLNGQPVPNNTITPHTEITAENVDWYLDFARMLKKYKF